MTSESNWDWEVGRKLIVDAASCSQEIEWREESRFSPDGETVAAVVNLGDAQFTVCVNDQAQEAAYDRVWGLRFASDGRLIALVSEEME
jgi:hypothetical protein